MSEVRLVRCPKCDKVLPEPSGFTVYQCGGCGAILKAKKKSLVSSSSSIVEDMAMKSPARSLVGDSYGGKSPLRESGVNEFYEGLPKSPMRDRFLDDLGNTPATSRAASRSPMRGRGGSGDFDHDGIKSPVRSMNASKSPMRGQGSGSGGLDEVGRPRSIRDAPKSPLRQGQGSEVGGNEEKDRVVKMTPKASFNFWLPDDSNEGQSHDNYVGEERTTWRGRAEDRADQISERGESVHSGDHGMSSEGSLGGDPIRGFGRNRNGGMYKDGRSRSENVGKYANSNVSDGRSNPHSDSNHGYDSPKQSFDSMRRPVSVQDLQQQRIELLQKYNELQDQLSGLDDAEVFYNNLDGHPMDESLKPRRRPIQQLPPDTNFQRPSISNHGPRLAHRGEDTNNHNYNRPQNDDRFSGPARRGPQSDQYNSNHPIPRYVPGRSKDFDHGRFEPHVNDTLGHHPACDCSRCYSNDWQGQDRHSTFNPIRRGNLRDTYVSSYSMDVERDGPRAYDPRMAQTSPQGRSSYPAHHRRRANVASLNKRLCRPISGGAPFVLCNNCFELLKLPGKFTARNKNQQRLQCGACSTVVSFDLQPRSLNSLPAEKKHDSVKVVGGSNEATNDTGGVTNSRKPQHRHHISNATSTNVGSYDFDAGDYGHPSMDSETSKAPKESRFNIGTVDEHNSDVKSVGISERNSPEIPMKIRPPPGSPLREHLDFSSTFTIYEDAEKQINETNVSPVVCEPSETEVPNNEMPTTTSRDSEEIFADIQALENDKKTQSPINNIESPSGRNEPRKAEVYVNGQAITQRAAKRAEKLAGNIQPGEYWYDPKAGFWGVMGDRCLGIIPPFIQEFRTPMPEDCSRGDSAVYVNGRELHKRDLELLAGRGLPTTRDMRYVVDISGRVLDENTRDFVVNLGRLAPSVERKKCGFGMQVPEQLEH